MTALTLQTAALRMNRKPAPKYENESDKSSARPSVHAAQRGSSRIARITSADVICGRDKLSHTHVGNKRFRQIIEMNRVSYQNATSRNEKTRITCQVIDAIRSSNGRFLKLDERTGEWSDAGDICAREKVSHALRYAKDPNRPRIKKPRKVIKHAPSAEENAHFDAAFKEQQKLFQELLQKGQETSGGKNEDSEDEHSS
eukprot:scaffold25978_cov122-Cylindrotheca_fusiformis.AAC.3